MSRHASTLEPTEVQGRKKVWAHLHLPKLQAWEATREDPNVISIKVPGQKIGYTDRVMLRNVVFHVSEAGRRRCLRENVRNVHAWVVGDAVPACFALADEVPLRKAVYCPFKGSTFVDSETFEPVHAATLAILIGKDVWYIA